VTSHICEARNGVLIPSDPARWLRDMAHLNGKRVEVELEKWRASRSGNQNRYYWGVVVALVSEWTGYTPNEAHDMLRGLFLRKPGTPGIPDTIRSTTDLSTAEFEEYMTAVRIWAGEHGVFIPQPNEQT
jgi:hypothetical protein